MSQKNLHNPNRQSMTKAEHTFATQTVYVYCHHFDPVIVPWGHEEKTHKDNQRDVLSKWWQLC